MRKKVLVFLLATVMLTSLAACNGTAPNNAESSGSPSASPTSSGGSKENVELTVLSLPGNQSGIATGWWAEEVKKATGITLNFLPTGDQGEQKLQALMASGSLPDIVVFKDYKQVQNAVDANMLAAYDDYKDLVPNLYANAATSLKYYADNLSGGKGKAYGVGVKIKTDPESKGDTGPYIRYDLYKKVGAPKIDTLDDLLAVLKKMQDAEPTNADGQKVYGLSIWKDWDQSYMTMGMFAAPYMGSKIPDERSLIEIQNDNGKSKVVSILSDDSAYMNFLRFLNKANQMGLLDPDSITQRFNDAVGKTTAGRVLFALDGWGTNDFSTIEKQNQGIGFRPIPFGYTRTRTALQPVGIPWTVAVSSSSKNIEKAMEFVNWNYSFDGARTTTSGPKGVTWDIDANGKPVLTQKYYDMQQHPDEIFADGKTYSKGASPLNAQAFWGSSIDPVDGAAVGNEFWDKSPYAPADTKLRLEWEADFGAFDMNAYLTKNADKTITEEVATYPTLSDDMVVLSSRIGDVIKNNSWKMVLAKDDAKFNSLKEAMVSDANKIGINDFVKWYTDEYNKAVELAAEYSK
ncbi:extracellular solute-binding protein [Cohnella terricola]|uniref:Extracellular solute-binding protein n=1 Tax=Cohnella terricola TaxID=1289167 RepID=A0A559J5P4_9BACL|nr:extracellular solute-binding protein [Cohnella terricola]TVX95200.1 extracellular solute-binding protein [Cohnella terricola]